jgi:hypothetical protein
MRWTTDVIVSTGALATTREVLDWIGCAIGAVRGGEGSVAEPDRVGGVLGDRSWAGTPPSRCCPAPRGGVAPGAAAVNGVQGRGSRSRRPRTTDATGTTGVVRDGRRPRTWRRPCQAPRRGRITLEAKGSMPPPDTVGSIPKGSQPLSGPSLAGGFERRCVLIIRLRRALFVNRRLIVGWIDRSSARADGPSATPIDARAARPPGAPAAVAAALGGWNAVP